MMQDHARRAARHPRSFARAIAVFALAIWALGISLPALGYLRHPAGDFGLSVDADLVVDGVDPGSAADSAGIQPGDVIDERATPIERRHIAPATRDPAPGDRETFTLVHAGSRRSVTLAARAASFTPMSTVEWLIGKLATLLFVAVGAYLVLQQPSPITWGFYLYCIGANPGYDATYFSFLAPRAFLSVQLASVVVIAAGYAGFLMFALRFPENVLETAWQTWCSRALPALFVAFAGVCVYTNVATGWWDAPAGVFDKLCTSISVAVYLLGIASFVATYAKSQPQDRQRIRWVILAVAIALGGVTAAIAAPELPFALPDWFAVMLGLAGFLVPAIVAYAVVRHRVIDVTFVLNRALVLGSLTAIIVAVFAFIDWFVGHVLSAARVALFVEIAAAIALSFSLNALHRRVEMFIESIFFRERRRAETRLAAVLEELPNAQSREAVEEALTREPAEAYGLTWATLYRRADGGTYARACVAGDASVAPVELRSDDPIVGRLSTKRATVSRDEWLAVPIIVAGLLESVMLYGEHTSGEALDPDEERQLRALARAAAHAFDRIELLALRRRAAELEARLQTP